MKLKSCGLLPSAFKQAFLSFQLWVSGSHSVLILFGFAMCELGKKMELCNRLRLWGCGQCVGDYLDSLSETNETKGNRK